MMVDTVEEARQFRDEYVQENEWDGRKVAASRIVKGRGILSRFYVMGFSLHACWTSI